MARRARVSPARILAAAATEFAERGFAGARVDRIARRARVNKAMLYYHFKSKEALYRRLLRDLFADAAARMQAIADGGGTPPEKLDRAVAELAALVRDHAHLPAIMLREVAEGGARLDRDTLASLARVPRAVAAIVQDGVARGAFRDVNPFFAYFTILAPILVFLAGAPIRDEIAHLHVANLRAGSPADFVIHVQETLRRALARDRAARPKR